MAPNLLILLSAAIVPMLLGMVWYNPSVLGTAWLKEAGLTSDQMKANQKPLKFLLGFICNFLLAFGLFAAGTHEFSVLGLVGGDPELIKTGTAAAFLSEYGGNFSTFSHGIAHGVVAILCFVIPLIGHQCLWRGLSFKYFAIDVGFWALCVVLMGGIIAQWGGVMLV